METKLFNFNRLVIWILLFRDITSKNIPCGIFPSQKKRRNFIPCDKDFLQQTISLDKKVLISESKSFKQLSTFRQNLSFKERKINEAVFVAHKRRIFRQKI